MLLPLGTDRPLARPTLVTYILIGLNILCFFGQKVSERFDPDAYERAMSRLAVWGGGDPALGEPGFRWWTLITSAFLHGGLWHLLGNMVFLWVFGPNIEDRLRRWGFTALYFLGAAASGGLHATFDDNPAIGASGAIATLTGSYLVLFPRVHVRVLWLLLLIGIYNIPAWVFIGLSVVWDVIGSGARDSGVAHLAHLGGYGFGFLVSLGLLGFKILAREPFDLFAIGRQAYRRRQFKEAAEQQSRAVEGYWKKARRSDGRGAAERQGTESGSAPEGETDESSALAKARAEVVRMLAAGDVTGAAQAYKAMADQFAKTKGGTTLSRKYQYDLANHFYVMKDHSAAAFAYERFLEAYPRDSESAQIRLLLGLIAARHMNDPVRAKLLIAESLAGLRDDGAKEMARKELEALG